MIRYHTCSQGYHTSPYGETKQILCFASVRQIFLELVGCPYFYLYFSFYLHSSPMKYLKGEHRGYYSGVLMKWQYWCVLGVQKGLKSYTNSKTAKYVSSEMKSNHMPSRTPSRLFHIRLNLLLTKLPNSKNPFKI